MPEILFRYEWQLLYIVECCDMMLFDYPYLPVQTLLRLVRIRVVFAKKCEYVVISDTCVNSVDVCLRTVDCP